MQCLKTSLGRRCFSVLKDSFPQSGAVRGADPSRPSVSKVMKEMLQNQTSAIPTGESTATPTKHVKHVIESDNRSMPQHLPRSYLPPSAGPAAVDLNRAGAAFRGLGQREQRFRAAPLPGAPSPQQSMWRPPGWNQPAEQKGDGRDSQYERPAIEVWGMRAVGLLVIFALYREFKDASISPTGQITKKPRPQIHPTQQEEEEQQRQVAK